jgi:integrase
MPNPHPPVRRSAKLDVLPAGIRRRSNGTYERRYHDALGRRRSVYAPTIEALLRLPVETIPLVLDRRLTLGAYLTIWLDGLTLRPNTIELYRSNVELYIRPTLDGVRLIDLTPDHVRAMYHDLRGRKSRFGRPLAPRTLGIVRTTISKALAQAVRDGRVTTNVALGIDPAAGLRQRRLGTDYPIPSTADLRAIADGLDSDGWFRPLFMLSTMTGLRQSEALGLRWIDVDFEDRAVMVTGALRRFDGELAETKTRTSRRAVRFSSVLGSELAHWRTIQRQQQLLAGTAWSGNTAGLVFTDATGYPLAGDRVSAQWRAMLVRLGLPHFRWHDLRHAYATGLLEQGANIAAVSKSLGHSSVSVTADVYHHLSDEAARELADLAGSRLARH